MEDRLSDRSFTVIYSQVKVFRFHLVLLHTHFNLVSFWRRGSRFDLSRLLVWLLAAADSHTVHGISYICYLLTQTLLYLLRNSLHHIKGYKKHFYKILAGGLDSPQTCAENTSNLDNVTLWVSRQRLQVCNTLSNLLQTWSDNPPCILTMTVSETSSDKINKGLWQNTHMCLSLNLKC